MCNIFEHTLGFVPKITGNVDYCLGWAKSNLSKQSQENEV